MNSNNTKKIIIPATITVKKFSDLLNLPVNIVISELMKNGILASINEPIDFETASIIAQDLGFKVETDTENSEKEISLEKLIDILKAEKESGENLKKRPPIVTILGHVDHGKTTLLDTIRKTNVVAKESGGITQHINAYQVKKKGEFITFIDTPGHEAFSAMRERGVSLADIAVLVVAADDGVRPQTKEVIQYLLDKKIPTVVAINKIDKPEANIQKVKQELSDNGIFLEDWGGQVLYSKISAKQNIGIDELLDNILLLAEMEDFKADYKRDALGIILESHLDPQKGPISSVLIKTGTLKEGQDIIAGVSFGRVRRIEDFKGARISQATPSTPISIIGLHSSPNSNDILQVITDKKAYKIKSGTVKNTSGPNSQEMLTVQKINKTIADDKIKKLNVILKSDVQGSLEAIQQILQEIKSEEVAIDFISTGVGNITESDIRLAGSSSTVVFGFNVDVTPVAKRMADASNIEIKNYKIIYELIEEIKKRLVAMLSPEIERIDLGKMKVLAIFKTGKKDMIVGGGVLSGKIVNNENIEIIRNNLSAGKGKISNLQQNKINVNEVESNKECGITYIGETKIKEGDILICYKEEIRKKFL